MTFKDIITTNSEQLGAKISIYETQVNATLQEVTADPDVPTNKEQAMAQSQAKDEYLAVLFLLNSDMKRYSTLIHDIKNEYTQGTNFYPTTLDMAYDYLVNYCVEHQNQVTDDGQWS